MSVKIVLSFSATQNLSALSLRSQNGCSDSKHEEARASTKRRCFLEINHLCLINPEINHMTAFIYKGVKSGDF